MSAYSGWGQVTFPYLYMFISTIDRKKMLAPSLQHILSLKERGYLKDFVYNNSFTL